MSKQRYDYTLLKSICDEFSVTLLVDYSDKYLTRDTRIIGKCILCDKSFDKSFNDFNRKRNFGCLECAKKIMIARVSATIMEKYGVKHQMHLQEVKNKIKSTNLKKYGTENARQSQIINDKIKNTNLQRYGCEYGLQNVEVQEKCKKSNLEKYGVENQMQREEIKEKAKQTNLEKYGTACPLHNEEIKEKVKQTNLEKYGTEYGFQNEDIKEKIKQSNLKKYGTPYSTQNEYVKEKCKKTNLEKYGVEYCTQNKDIMEKMTKHMYKSKEYVMPSGKIIKIQGYEHLALDELLKKENINEEEIITGCTNVPTIWYEDETGKKHRHFVDIFIPIQNRCIEVKSTWTAKLHKDIIFLKQDAGKKLGYKYEIWVYSKSGDKVESHF